MNRGTLNSINSGPNGGKTTLYMQALAAHIYHKPFSVPGLTFPDGRIAIVQTDRPSDNSLPLMSNLGLWKHPDIEIINFIDEPELHALTRPVSPSQTIGRVETLCRTITERIKDTKVGTLVLDLYDDFQAGDSTRAAAYYSRANALWAKQLDVAILGVIYCHKQSTAKQSLRLQDRQSGFTQNQASMSWKYTLIDTEELKLPYGLIGYTPPQGNGNRGIIYTLRGREIEDGDRFGLFRKYTGPTIPTIEEIMVNEGIDYNAAWKQQRSIISDVQSAIEAGEHRESLI